MAVDEKLELAAEPHAVQELTVTDVLNLIDEIPGELEELSAALDTAQGEVAGKEDGVAYLLLRIVS